LKSFVYNDLNGLFLFTKRINFHTQRAKPGGEYTRRVFRKHVQDGQQTQRSCRVADADYQSPSGNSWEVGPIPSVDVGRTRQQKSVSKIISEKVWSFDPEITFAIDSVHALQVHFT
jgi:hypothetical protein